MEAPLWMLLEGPVDSDVTSVTNLLGQIGRVENELWFEEGIRLCPTQRGQVQPNVEILERAIDKARMARFIAGHIAHQLPHFRVLNLGADVCVENAAAVFGGGRADQKVEELVA